MANRRPKQAAKRIETLEPEIIKKNPQTWYLEDININYSFASLEREANKLGANLANGDVLIADNANKTKRKIFKKTANAYIILYVGLLRENTFLPAKERGNGKVNLQNKPLIHFLFY